MGNLGLCNIDRFVPAWNCRTVRTDFVHCFRSNARFGGRFGFRLGRKRRRGEIPGETPQRHFIEITLNAVRLKPYAQKNLLLTAGFLTGRAVFFVSTLQPAIISYY